MEGRGRKGRGEEVEGGGRGRSKEGVHLSVFIVLILQRSVVKIVREKYLNQVDPSNEVQFQRFLSELYVFLVDQMHLGLKKVESLTVASYL